MVRHYGSGNPNYLFSIMSILFQGLIGLLLVSCPAIEKLCPNELQKIVSKLGRLKLAKRGKWKAKGKLDSPTHRLMDSAPYKHQVSLFCSDMSCFCLFFNSCHCVLGLHIFGCSCLLQHISINNSTYYLFDYMGDTSSTFHVVIPFITNFLFFKIFPPLAIPCK